MAQKITIWTFSSDPAKGQPRPFEVTCDADKFGYPHYDDTGDKMFDNTHFRTEREAWDCLLKNADAGENLWASSYRAAQAGLDKATKHLAEAAAFAVEVRDAFATFKKVQRDKKRGA